MKKFFTLIAAVAMAASVNAQTQEWNFSDWDLTTYGSISTDVSKDGLTIYANADKAVVLDANSKTVDGVKYTQRLKFGGTGSVSDLNNMARVVAFNVTGTCIPNKHYMVDTSNKIIKLIDAEEYFIKYIFYKNRVLYI